MTTPLRIRSKVSSLPEPSQLTDTKSRSGKTVTTNGDGAGSTMAAEADVASPGTDTDTRAATSVPLTRRALGSVSRE